jgi:peptide deformylase
MKNLELVFLDTKEKNRRKSKEVKKISEKYLPLIEQMKNICIKNKAYAMAAPQVGIYERFILIITTEEMTNKDEKEIKYEITSYFNPIIKRQTGLQCFYEYCMSVPGVIGKVYRPYEIEIEAYDIKGNIINKTVYGFEAIIFCHEIDHLDGIEYTDKAYDIRYDIDYDKKIQIRKENPHKIINKIRNFEELVKNIGE